MLKNQRKDAYQSPDQSLLIARQTRQRLPYPIPTHYRSACDSPLSHSVGEGLG
jgi:hypothetical protein